MADVTQQKTLILVRHAKSCWKHESLPDIDRPLNKRGKRDAPEMASRLVNRGVRPDVIISSAALRALTTARVIAVATEIDAAQIMVDDELYGASEDDVLEIVRQISDVVGTAVVVGHNPTLTDLANRFADEEIENVPTSGMLFLNVPDWQRVNEATLLDFDYPKAGRPATHSSFRSETRLRRSE